MKDRIIEINGWPLRVTESGEIYTTDHSTVCKDGIIRRFKGHLLRQSTNKRGYAFVTVGNKTYKAHRIVAYAFLGSPESGQVINHKNEVKTDNRSDNLEWVSQADNVRYSYERHSHRSRPKKVQQFLNGELIASFDSAREAARKTGFSQGAISAVCRGEFKQLNGFTWVYGI